LVDLETNSYNSENFCAIISILFMGGNLWGGVDTSHPSRKQYFLKISIENISKYPVYRVNVLFED